MKTLFPYVAEIARVPDEEADEEADEDRGG
jgi:hypothetical protein